MTTYIAILRKEAHSDFGVNFPDFPGCVTAGRSLDEARRMAVEALQLHIKGMMEDHEPIPEPAGLDAVMDDPDNHDGVAFLVDVATNPARSVRVQVMLPEDVVVAIDRTTNNRSRFLTEAAKARLHEMA
jgi:predicted RNase H-like HicB family nuclease